MSYSIIVGDITDVKCDIIVNASNGIGYMGGSEGLNKLLPGVAESIHYRTQGVVERKAKEVCKKNAKLPMWLFGSFKAGEIFETDTGNLKASIMLHAVTMKFPGSKAKLQTIETLVKSIIDIAKAYCVKTVAIPLLGTGTGGLQENEVLSIYEKHFEDTGNIEFIIVKYT